MSSPRLKLRMSLAVPVPDWSSGEEGREGGSNAPPPNVSDTGNGNGPCCAMCKTTARPPTQDTCSAV